MSDQLLWDQLRKGRKEALEQIYKLHADALYDYGMRLCQNTDLVEDCLHDLFIYIWDRKSHLGKTNQIRPYLIIAFKRDLIKRINKRRKNNISPIADRDYKIADEGQGAEDIWISKEETSGRHRQLEKSLQSLSKRQREAVYLRFHQNMSLEDIAAALKINNQSVRNLLFQALQKLRKNIGPLLLLIIILCMIEYKTGMSGLLRKMI